MTKKDVKLGAVYEAKVSGRKVLVKIIQECRYGGWNALNLATGRVVRIKTAARLTRYIRDGRASDWVVDSFKDVIEIERSREQ
jgi:hypothetical protein